MKSLVHHIGIFILVWLTAFLPAPASITPSASTLAGSLPPDKTSMVWHDNLKAALTRAGFEYQMILVVFSSPDCPWCVRLKTETRQNADTRALLRHFVLAEIDVSTDPATAATYQILGVPTLKIISASGDIKKSVSGYMSQDDLQRMLKEVLNPELLQKQDGGFSDMLKSLAGNSVPAEQWLEIMAALGVREKRKPLHDAILKLAPFPKKDVVKLLENHRLSIRLGTLEILEELAGDTFGYDPWNAPTAYANSLAIKRWAAWASSADTNAAVVYAAITKDQIYAYIPDIISGHPERSLRARQMLRHGGLFVADTLAEFLENHQDLPVAAIKAVKEAQYAVILADIDCNEPDALAHRLVFGSLDMRQKSILNLSSAGAEASRILRDYLDDPHPLMREAAVDALVATGLRSTVGFFERRLQVEKDPEVVCGILRGLGRVRSKKGLAILVSYLNNTNEDLLITALNSIARLKSKKAADAVAKCLDDPRWRVRVAALETIGALKTDTLADKMAAFLKDPDEFVRYSAVKALMLSSAKKSAPRLEETFLREDGLKGAVVAAFVNMELPLPASFKPALMGKNPDILLSVLEQLNDYQGKYVGLAAAFVNHADLDVSCAAIRVVASRGMKSDVMRGQIINILKTGKNEMKLAALEAITEPDRSDQKSYSIRNTQMRSNLGIASNKPPVLESLVNDFFGNGAAGKTDAGDQSPFTSTSAPPPAGKIFQRGSIEDLLGEAENLLTSSSDQEIRFQAALLLSRYGSEAGLPYLQNGLAERPIAERQLIAASLAPLTGNAVIPCLRLLVNDPAENVRNTAVQSCLKYVETPAVVDVIFEELLRSGALLKPYEVYDYQIVNAARQSGCKQRLSHWARRLIAEGGEPALRVFGLILLESCGVKNDENNIRPCLQSQDPFLRRAAYHTLAKLNKEGFTNVAFAVAADSSEYVRMVLPDVYNRTASRWVHYFDKEHFSADYHHWVRFSSQDRMNNYLPPDIEALLHNLTRDESAKVRIETFFCLIANQKTVSLADFIKTIDSFPDRKEIRSRITNYLTANYQYLDKNFGVLVRYMDDDGDSEMLERTRKHFAAEEDDEATTAAGTVRLEKPRKPSVMLLKKSAAPSATETQKLKMVYFTSQGCSECARVERLMPQLKDVFPWLEVERKDVRTVAAMRLNEALSEKFGVPENLRLVSPAVFAAAGFLVKKDITFDRLADLLARSAAMSPEDWLVAPEGELAGAEKAIVQRYAMLSPLIIAGSGLLDGVNPCAFATIIFLISYLQVARKTARDTAQVAFAFIAGVFLAYLALGLGLAELISRMTALKRAGDVLNWGLAAFVLVLMLLNVRDGILCRQGRLRDTALQLPGFIKHSTHVVIRRGVRHAHFLAAAFVMGIVISFLELVCTGQVYAPTIGFIVKTRGITAGAVGLLLLYNAAFILPLIVVFVLVFFGMTAEKLTRFLQQHVAAVKFSTAALFLALFLLISFWR